MNFWFLLWMNGLDVPGSSHAVRHSLFQMSQSRKSLQISHLQVGFSVFPREYFKKSGGGGTSTSDHLRPKKIPPSKSRFFPRTRWAVPSLRLILRFCIFLQPPENTEKRLKMPENGGWAVRSRSPRNISDHPLF